MVTFEIDVNDHRDVNAVQTNQARPGQRILYVWVVQLAVIETFTPYLQGTQDLLHRQETATTTMHRAGISKQVTCKGRKQQQESSTKCHVRSKRTEILPHLNKVVSAKSHFMDFIDTSRTFNLICEIIKWDMVPDAQRGILKPDYMDVL